MSKAEAVQAVSADNNKKVQRVLDGFRENARKKPGEKRQPCRRWWKVYFVSAGALAVKASRTFVFFKGDYYPEDALAYMFHSLPVGCCEPSSARKGEVVFCRNVEIKASYEISVFNGSFLAGDVLPVHALREIGANEGDCFHG